MRMEWIGGINTNVHGNRSGCRERPDRGRGADDVRNRINNLSVGGRSGLLK
jgi:hypothetical protein